jgi:uncharacterized protein
MASQNETKKKPHTELQKQMVATIKHLALDDTLSMIGNVSSGISILILQGENDSQTPVEQGLLLQQRLTELNHPDHLIITYPDLGHELFSSSQWTTGIGPIQQKLAAHSGLSHSYATTTASTIRANTSSLNTSTTSASSSSSKR